MRYWKSLNKTGSNFSQKSFYCNHTITSLNVDKTLQWQHSFKGETKKGSYFYYQMTYLNFSRRIIMKIVIVLDVIIMFIMVSVIIIVQNTNNTTK